MDHFNAMSIEELRHFCSEMIRNIEDLEEERRIGGMGHSDLVFMWDVKYSYIRSLGAANEVLEARLS
jgi:hypothetical protein